MTTGIQFEGLHFDRFLENFDLVFEALDAAINGMNPGPSVVLANTIAGKGVSFMEGTWQWHLGFLGKKDLEKAYEEIERGLE